MKRPPLLAAMTLALIASQAHAQSFLEAMARKAAEAAAARAAAALEQRVGGTTPQGAPGSRPASSPPAEAAPAVMRPRSSSAASAAAAAPAAKPNAAPSVFVGASGPAPWPNNLDNPRVRLPVQFKFDQALEDQKTAFRKFGEVSCNDCEGGVSFDTAAKLFLNLRDPWQFDAALGKLNVGQSMTWRGRASTGAVTVVSAAPIGPFACRQLRWDLKRGDKSMSRPGLVCLGKSNPDADNERWIEVL